MASVDHEQTYQLSIDHIRTVITERSPGSFVLGVIAEDGTFTPQVVGRATNDVRQELEYQAHLNTHHNGFRFRYAASPHEAFEQQCQAFHACGECEGLENKAHPARPSHTDWLCPVCGSAFLKGDTV